MDAVTQLTNALAGRYAVEEEVGRGGMATVYRARDLKHARHVALKVLSPELGAVLGVERFLGEIRVTANLQHPNLLPLFDSGEADGLLFYVMPFVEGETLRQRIAREKQLPIDEAVRIAVAIANALDHAHRHGVIHRDLKPENVLLQDGQPLLADFGIALAVANAGGTRVTQTGLSLGTPQYMSPEQATGDRNIDGRTDIYSLAAVTYEMLTGDAPHSGTTAQAIIARLMTEDPRPISSSRRSVPAHVDAAVAHALEKLPADRFQTAKEFADALQGRGAPMTSDRPAHAGAAGSNRAERRQRWLVPAAVGVVSAVAAFALAGRWRAIPVDFPPARFEFSAPPGVTPLPFGTPVALSPNGRSIVFTGMGRDLRLYSRAIGELEVKPIPGTEGGIQPSFSPDGRWIAFSTQAGLQKIEAGGGVPVFLAKMVLAHGLDWSPDGTIVAGASRPYHGLLRLPDAGGTPVEFTKPDSAQGVTDHVFPIVLADGRTVVFALYDGRSIRGSRLAMTSLADGIVHPLDVAGIAPLGVVDGQLVYVRADGTVMAAPIDVRGRRITGGSVPVMEPVTFCLTCKGGAAVRLSRNGSLVALRGSSMTRLVLLDRTGGERAISQHDNDYMEPSFSPDGRRVAVSVAGTDSAHNRDIWIYDVATSSPMRLTTGKDNFNPRWTPDGRRVLFTAGDHRNPRQVWVQAADGSSAAQRITEAPEAMSADLARDGRSLVFGLGDGNVQEIHAATIGSGAPASTFAHDGASTAPSFSPDGRWVAYSADETGRAEIYVRPYPGGGGRVQVSVNGGDHARWINGGRSLVYETSGQTFEVAEVITSPTFGVTSRAPFFNGTAPQLDFTKGTDVSPDGRYVAVVRPSGDGMKILVVSNWAQELREHLRR